jgi:hypothetical protein
MKTRTLLFAVAVCACGMGQASLPATPSLADILPGLSSNDFSVRQAAQAQLNAIGPDQVGALRQAAGKATDSELNARLLSRVQAMEVYVATHPVPLTLDLRDATLDAVVQALHGKLPNQSLHAGRVANPPKLFTLPLAKGSFWELLLALDAQHPLEIDAPAPFSIGGLMIEHLGSRNGVSVRQLTVIDSFATHVSFRGTPGTGAWQMNLLGFADPRISIAEAGPMHIEALTDQEGRSLLGLVTSSVSLSPNPSRDNPHLPWADRIHLGAAPGLSRVGRLKVTREMSMFDRVESRAIDLANNDRIETPRGTVMVIKNADNTVTFRLPAPDGNAVAAAVGGAGGRGSPSAAALNTVENVVIQLDAATIRNIKFGILPGTERTTPAFMGPLTGKVSWAVGARRFPLTFELKNIELPPAIPPILVPAGGEAGVVAN